MKRGAPGFVTYELAQFISGLILRAGYLFAFQYSARSETLVQGADELDSVHNGIQIGIACTLEALAKLAWGNQPSVVYVRQSGQGPLHDATQAEHTSGLGREEAGETHISSGWGPLLSVDAVSRSVTSSGLKTSLRFRVPSRPLHAVSPELHR
jgi:hypothetical protein